MIPNKEFRLNPTSRLCLAALCATALVGCGSAGQAPSPSAAPVAIATTTPLGSIVSDITSCAGAKSTTLMKPGVDPHDFALASDQMAALTRAKLVVANGLGLEGGLATAIKNVKADGGRVYEVAPDVSPLKYSDIEAAHAGETAAEHAAHTHGEFDPHVALDAGRMAQAAANIGKQLAEATGDATFTECGTKVEAQLKATDASVREKLAAIPPARRILITDHEAFNYFAKAYGFEIAGVVIPGGATDAEPSSADIAQLVATVKAEKVPAVFSNTAVSPKMVQAVAQEAGTDVRVVPLFVDSVGAPGSGAETYSSMMLANADAIAGALT